MGKFDHQPCGGGRVFLVAIVFVLVRMLHGVPVVKRSGVDIVDLLGHQVQVYTLGSMGMEPRSQTLDRLPKQQARQQHAKHEQRPACG